MDYFEIEKARVRALGHEDFHIRSQMLSTVSHAARVPEKATRIVLEQIDRYGWQGAYEYSHQITRLPHTPESPEWVMAILASDLQQEATGDRLPGEFHLLVWLEKAPVEWLVANIERLRTALPEVTVSSKHPKGVGRGTQFLRFAESRVAADTLGEWELREGINRLVSACAGRDEYPSKEIEELKVLCEAAARRGVFTDGELKAMLEGPFDDDMRESDFELGYRANAALMVLSERGEPAPIEALVNLFDLDWDWTNELIAETLERTVDEAGVARILELYPTLEWHARIFLTGVLEAVRFPGFEEDFQKAYRGEKDIMLNTTIAMAIALCGTDGALETVRQHLRKHGDYSESGPLRDLVFCQEIVLGRGTAAAARHLGRMEREMKRQSEAMGALGGMFGGTAGLLDELIEESAALRIPERRPTIVGRNEPCPCGSGKKYKKCCGR